MKGTINVSDLAKLARLLVSDEELAKLEREVPAILEFVGKLPDSGTFTREGSAVLRNVMREDGEPHESGAHADVLLKAAPNVIDGRVVVKQVISREKSH
ncbi:hypothetical protein A2673_02390 [Candidatus Kaiserbacteria bacterium RIFCSPHIGHO2_01_FULL_50_13]|uniref:Aspartyl/glutamyl-tRNA(Asn/Gln) amidotransferase subunit C n=1 Tax=Candidatus Kaiserbacteria bacterium RIFCSPLOWO2_01_FULL_50_24 TaxID=1798507 RepID=A0A1F6EQW5_9BACT|nr:MAG: hypothetical protein A2673_02390 [Candidatus Kaiserbacteria bacterium RIFCSPHIGHO2_01_FULL_50_13]OGG76025.1 MAG: hypothetical protein A3A34_00025 [Candidatus Kaiserbacteria bacterium RIFCSPLOWO2_01_FULL_50_24]OGG82032.1 MAG: hypothetical protein A3H74_03445 [Candidatus Kaiserbacteria bacterium RIFCSPLOWO2_02_FULL_51_13]